MWRPGASAKLTMKQGPGASAHHPASTHAQK